MSPLRIKSGDAPTTSRESATDDLTIHVIRSERRHKTISARLVNWHTLEVRAPARVSEAELQAAIRQLVQRTLAMRGKMRHFASDPELQARAQHVNDTIFDGRLRWRSIRFVPNQHTCFGSCSPVRGTIRLSDRLKGAPAFVLDYVITHELAHLLEPNHSSAFWNLVYRYDRAERARGYLMALQLEEDLITSADSSPTEEEEHDEG